MHRSPYRKRRPSLRAPLWALATALTAIVGCGGTSDSAPTPVALEWLQAMSDEDLGRACSLMDAKNHRPFGEARTPTERCEQRWLHSDNTPPNWKPKPDVLYPWGMNEPRGRKVTVSGDEATVIAVGPSGFKQEVWLRREGGHWLVDGEEYPI